MIQILNNGLRIWSSRSLQYLNENCDWPSVYPFLHSDLKSETATRPNRDWSITTNLDEQLRGRFHNMHESNPNNDDVQVN